MPKIKLAIPQEILDQAKNDPRMKYVGEYNTKLTLPEMMEFHSWAKNKYGDHDSMLREMGDYDIQGAWKAQKSGQSIVDPVTGHWPDTFKKPNHITFSNQSMYHSEATPGGQWIQTNNKWQYKPSEHVKNIHGKSNLMNYFKNYEKDADLLFD